MAEVYLRQHQPLLLLLLLLLLHRHALLQPAGEDLLGLDSELVEFAVGTDCANQ